jgi:formylglycine-generating enzyme required for sulfatase activity
MAKKKRKPIRRKPQPADTQENQIEIRLKPFLGIPPGIYLSILYGILILFVLFMLLFFKGLRDQGEYLQVTTFPPGASVTVDGTYVGSSPCEVLVRKGFHNVTISKPYFEPLVLEDAFQGPVFATLFFRPRRSLQMNLELSDPQGLATQSLRDFSANPHIPEILSETVWAGYNSSSATEYLYYFLDKSRYFVTNSLQLYSFIYALSSLDANVGAMTPNSLISTVQNIVHFKQKYENFPFWLAVILQEESGQRVVDTAWFSGFLSDYRSQYGQLQERINPPNQPGPGGSTQIRGLRFYNVPAGELIQGAGKDGFSSVQIPHHIAVPSFYISETEVPNRLYREFVDENPNWDPANKLQLQEQGLADDQYLAGWQAEDLQSDWQELPVSHVSFYAAQAFCRWLSAKLPDSHLGYSARLPFESEWEWAARGGIVGADSPTGEQSAGERFFSPGIKGPGAVGSSSANGYGLRDMTGNLWEWCSDWYSPVKYLFTSWNTETNDFDSSREIPLGTEKVIRGGSWANEEELIKISTRGSQPPDWCTPYIGFRVILSRYIP